MHKVTQKYQEKIFAQIANPYYLNKLICKSCFKCSLIVDRAHYDHSLFTSHVRLHDLDLTI